MFNDMKIVVGMGLVALDVILEKKSNKNPFIYAGGSCGNVLSILSYLGFDSYPVARLAKNKATEELLKDIKSWGVKTDLLFKSDDGSTPIIIQRLTTSREGLPAHRFEFRNPEDGKFLPSFKPVLAKNIDSVFQKKSNCDFFYFDRVSRSSLDLAKLYKKNGAIIIFEPSSLKLDEKTKLNEIVEIVDIIKFSNDRIPHYNEIFPQGKIPIEIETLGKNGINYRINNLKGKKKWNSIKPYKLEHLVDSAGAGDWATAGIIKFMGEQNISFINSIDENIIENMLKYAQSYAALSCLFKGSRGLMYEIDLNSLNNHLVKLNSDVIYNKNENQGISIEKDTFNNTISSLLK